MLPRRLWWQNSICPLLVLCCALTYAGNSSRASAAEMLDTRLSEANITPNSTHKRYVEKQGLYTLGMIGTAYCTKQAVESNASTDTQTAGHQALRCLGVRSSQQVTMHTASDDAMFGQFCLGITRQQKETEDHVF